MKFSVALKQKLLRFFLKLYTSKQSKNTTKKNDPECISTDATIIISTFEKRFFEFTIPLLRSIRTATSIPVTIVINGNFNALRDEKNYRNFVIATQEYPNVNLVTFNTFRGWSSMLNAGILHSDSDVSLVINDDVYLNPAGFSFELEKIIKLTEEKGLLLINNSWSHFAISSRCLSSIGFFDEHFLGIGEEDGDYATRYKAFFKHEVPSIRISGILNFVDRSRDDSIALANGKYSLFNSVYLRTKMNTESISGAVASQGSEGSLRSIFTWRRKLYKTLAWSDQTAIEIELEKYKHFKNSKTEKEN